MFALYKIAGAFAAPPGLFVIILLAMAAALFLKSRRTRFAFGTAASLAIFVFAAALCVMSTPAGARFITGPLEAKYAAQLPPDGETADFLLLPGGSLYDPGGSSVPTPPLAPGGGWSYAAEGPSVQPAQLALERVYTAVTLASGRAGKSVLVMSGGNVFGDKDRSEASAMRDAARAMGWRGEIILEERSRTTAENMKYSAALLRARGLQTVAVVTNAFHLPRAMRLARQSMPEARLYSAAPPRRTDPIIRGLPSFLPDAASLHLSCIGMRERIGTATAAILNR